MARSEREIAEELARELAEALEPAWDTGSRGALDRRLARGILVAAYARHQVTTAAQADRIYEQVKPMLADLERRYRQSQAVVEDAPQPRVLN